MHHWATHDRHDDPHEDRHDDLSDGLRVVPRRDARAWPGSAFRATRAFAHDVDRPLIDPDRVDADWVLMYDWLRRDDEMASVCGFTAADLDPGAQTRRVAGLRREVGPQGRTFDLHPAELEFWVRYAWINADRCSGRQHALQDAVIRHLPGVTTAADMLRAAVQHAELAMDAQLAPQTVVTVVGPPSAPGSPGQLFATEQLLRPAGYAQEGGGWIGDGGYLDLTDWVLARVPDLVDPAPGYPLGTFDALPMIAVGRAGTVAAGTCPPTARDLVDLPWPRHPDAAEDAPGPDEPFACWPTVPLQTNFALDVAGQRYCVLFNGWYVDEEIAANLLDPRRYAWTERVGAAVHGQAERERLRRTDRLDEYRTAQIEIATLRAVRTGFRAARRRLNTVGSSQSGFGKFHERHVAVHGEPPPNDTGWTANRFGSRYRHASHAMPHVPQQRGGELVRHWLTFRSLRSGVDLEVVDLA
jgi:nitric oxide synthase oxygenase domain/subunit